MGNQKLPIIKMDKQCKRKKNKRGIELRCRTNHKGSELTQKKVEIFKFLKYFSVLRILPLYLKSKKINDKLQ